MNKTAGRAIYHLFSISLSLLMIYPLLWTLASSLKPASEIFTHAGSLIPSVIKWDNYVKGWEGFGDTGFGQFFRNTAFFAFFSVIGSLLSSSAVACGFSRLQFPFKKLLFICLMGTIMLPGEVTMIPQYILFHYLGWVNTYLPLIVPQFIGGSAFFIFLVMQFIRGIPRELDEAAFIDGASRYGVFGYIILPICRPVLATVAIFSFIWAWDSFLGPLIYLNNPKLYTISLGLSLFADPQSVSNWGSMFAMSILSLLPLFVIFAIFQRNIVQGTATIGLKG